MIMLDMLNQLTGFGILVLDDLDNLDAQAFGKVMKALKDSEMMDRYDHVFISMVDHADLMSSLPEDVDRLFSGVDGETAV